MHLVIGIVKFYTYLGGETEEQNHDFFLKRKRTTHTRRPAAQKGEKLKSYFKSLCAAVAALQQKDIYGKMFNSLLSKKKHRQTMYF